MIALFGRSEDWLRLGVFAAVFLVLAAWEVRAARRAFDVPRRTRWGANLGMLLAGAVVVRVVLPLSIVEVADWAAARRWGLFTMLGLPAGPAIVWSIVLLDLAIYAQHVAFHRVPWLWRLHRVHHADPGFDVTTGVRFHPFETLLSAGIKMTVVVLLGAPAVAVVVFEILLNASSMFSHGNVTVALPSDAVLRRILVTPDMHRVHHSTLPSEHHTNFGFNLSVWDRVFRTYRAQPAHGHEQMAIGLGYDVRQACALTRALLIPFTGRRPGVTSR